jgi:hypothetical protein
MVVMLGHFEETFARYASAPRDVLQERHDVFAFLGTAKADDQYRVV